MTLRAVLDRWLVRLSAVGADPADDDDTRLRKALLVLMAVLILPVSFVWASLYIAFGSVALVSRSAGMREDCTNRLFRSSTWGVA